MKITLNKLLIFILLSFTAMAEFKTYNDIGYTILKDDVVGGHCFFSKIDGHYFINILPNRFIIGEEDILFLQVLNENNDMIILEADCNNDYDAFSSELSKDDRGFIMESKELTITTFDSMKDRWDFYFKTKGIDFKKLK